MGLKKEGKIVSNGRNIKEPLTIVEQRPVGLHSV